MLPWGISTSFEGALLGKAALSLEKQFLTLSSAKLARRS
jgi:hypothetical protein